MDEKVEPTMVVLDAAERADVDFVHDGLRRYNDQYAPPGFTHLYVFLRDGEGTLVGGLLGVTYWGWLVIDVLWVDERFRGQGYGDRMLAAAEDEARRRGCSRVQLDTLSFQARPFYEKRGYRVFGELEDFPAGSEHTRYYLTKKL